MNASTALRFALLANLALVAAGCGVFGSSDDAPASPAPGDQPGMNGPAPKAPPVGGPADDSELVEAFGVFVAPTGRADGDGSRKNPLATIQGAIEMGKQVGKRVYVCSGTYKEALVLADSISVIGGLDCRDSEAWRAGTGVSRIEAPTSPAVRAKNIASATRLEGLEIIAPDGAAPSESSIGMIAEGSKLTIARSKITAGNGASGADGVEGTQLTPSPTINGAAFYAAAQCGAGTCVSNGYDWYATPASVGGTNACDGAPGHAAGSGGKGGWGGNYKQVQDGPVWLWQPQDNNAAFSATAGEAGSGSAGASGADGSNGQALGTFSADGYAAANGVVGTDGVPGAGGAGGSGASPGATLPAGSSYVGYTWRGFGGAGGGAGGCPGLAGSAGGGGGASIAALVLDSNVTLEATELTSGRGGNGGHGTFGSEATAGGKAGSGGIATLLTVTFGKDGGRGGAAGISGHGASGPSIAFAVHGTTPQLDAASKLTPGAGGAAIDAAARTDSFGTTKTIPAVPAGASKDVLAF